MNQSTLLLQVAATTEMVNDMSILLKKLGSITITLDALPDDTDIDWDVSPEEIEDIENGTLLLFCAKVSVTRNNHIIGVNYLGRCVYRDLEDFIKGMHPRTVDYCRDMVHEALIDARQTVTLR